MTANEDEEPDSLTLYGSGRGVVWDDIVKDIEAYRQFVEKFGSAKEVN